MNELTQQATSFNKNPPIWSAEFPLNQLDFIRIEITCLKGSPIVSVRCWFRPDDGPERPTRRGIAFAIRHLPTTAARLNEALCQARGLGLLPPDDRADRRGEGGADV
jgi:hypothetical protein